jgi:hypothetical protein
MFSRLLTTQQRFCKTLPSLQKLNQYQSIISIPATNSSVTLQRFLHQHSILHNAAAAVPATVGETAVTPASSTSPSSTTTTKQPTTFSSLIEKYGGWYPFAGLTAVVMLSQEVFVLNEEGYQALLTGFWFLFVGVFAVDYLRQPLKESVAEDMKELNDATGIVIDYIERRIRDSKNLLALDEELPKYRDEYISLVKKATVSSDVRNRLAAREAVIQRLQALKQREATEKNRKAAALFDETLAHVRQEVKNLSKQDRDAIINYAIRSIAGDAKALPASEDPIVRIFDNYLRSRNA